MSAQVGTVLDGKYEIVRSLAAGGMGEVFLARHLHLDELRVVKVLRRDLVTDPESQQRFLREARLATQVKHPNVAILHDCTRLEDTGGFYMVWEYVEGEDAHRRLEARGPFPVPLVLEIGIQALRGLGAIHTQGIIHRDVSPDNLMIFTDSHDRMRLKIIDLGLAKTLAPDPRFEVTQTGTFMGKLRYCSPEQASTGEGAELDRRTDIYSLGLVLYELATGVLPFDGAATPAAVVRRAERDPLPMAGRNPDVEVPEALDGAILKALARDPDGRYPDAVAFIEALDEVRSGLGGRGVVPLEIAGPRKGDGAPPKEAGVTRAGPARRPPSPSRAGELSREERADLLAQIDRAARRVREATKVVKNAEDALEHGRVDEARRIVAEIERASPGAEGLRRLRDRLADIDELEGRRARIAELERLVTGYIQKKQAKLARLALEELLDLYPIHPKRDDFESWVELLQGESEEEARAAAAHAAGREALADGDLDAARRQLDALRRTGVEGATEAFESEIAEAERSAEREARSERRRERFDTALADGDWRTAERELAALEGSITRVGASALAARLAEAKERAEADAAEAPFERRFAARLAAGDWTGAREAARALAARRPDSARPEAMLTEVDDREERQRHDAAVADGERQIERLVAAGQADQARLALSILLRLDPANRRRRAFERQIAALSK